MHFSTYLIHALPPSERRGFDRREAASYICVSVSHFDKLVREGFMPNPLVLLGRNVWDKTMLDRALDRLGDGLMTTIETSDWDLVLH